MYARKLLWISLFTALTAIGSWIRIPVFPVPFTLQTLFVYLSGSLLGPVSGPASQLLYIAVGLAGTPVFSGGGGPAYVTHPTFGYLLGFPAAAWFIGQFNRRSSLSTIQSGLRYVAGTGIIHGCGLLYLLIYFHWISPQDVNLSHLFWTGSLIFLPGEALKIGIALFLERRLNNLAGCP